MPELREVFEMVTKQTEPDVDAWREQQRRQRQTSRNRKLGALAVAAAIGVVAVVVVIRAADEGTGTRPGRQPTDGAPTARSIPRLPSGSIEPGRYAFTTFGPGLDASYRITIDIPDGYRGFDGWAAVKVGTNQTAVSTMAIGGVYADPCQWEGTQLDRSAISSTDEVAAALATQKGLRVSNPTDVTVDGFAGTYMERRVPAQTDTSACDEAQFRVYASRGPSRGARYLVAGELQQLWIVDIEGVPLVIDASLNPGTSAQVRAGLQQMVESVRIDPR